MAWTYAPKHLTNSRETVEAAAILAAIHLNDGQLAMGRFLENLGYNISLLHDIFIHDIFIHDIFIHDILKQITVRVILTDTYLRNLN